MNLLFLVVFELDLGSLAPGIHFNDEFWMAEWNSTEMIRLDENGQLIENFTIPTLTDVRSMTWDGTSLWMGNKQLSKIYILR